MRTIIEQKNMGKLDRTAFQKQKLPRLNHEEIKNLSSPVTNKEVESVMKKSQTK